MTPLARLLAARIAVAGPMPLSDFMAECLLHPVHGYYTTKAPFGAAGDFVTAPEISQMFGELLGLCLAQAWVDQGSPAPFALAELGPGRGVLMAAVLRAVRGVPGFLAAARVVLVEASPALRDVQRAALAGHGVVWADRAEELPEGPLYLLANEFFDALPIRQFVRAGDAWAETMVGLDAAGALTLGRGPAAALALLAHRLADTAEGEVVEVCPAAGPIMGRIGAQIAGAGGLALVVDYGGWQSRGDTFQAVRRHGFADPLAAPGEADLTAHVDFGALALAARPAVHGFTTQGALLDRLGIGLRAGRLAAGLEGAALQVHLAATRRLTHAQEMGTVFKALAVYPPGAPVPPGFA